MIKRIYNQNGLGFKFYLIDEEILKQYYLNYFMLAKLANEDFE
jgi:hypothetical protein